MPADRLSMPALKSVCLVTALQLLVLFCSPFSAAAARPIALGSSRSAVHDLKKELHALIIGVSRYRAGWDQLPGVQKDIDAVKKRLEMSGFEITVLMDPDRKQFEQAFTVLGKKLQGASGSARLLIYYAGHGENLEGVGYLAPVDAPHPRVDKTGFKEKAINLDWMRRQLLNLPVRHAIMLLDNCFSGTVFKTTRGTPPYSPSVQQMVAFPSREIVSAGTEDQTVPDDSIFRRYFEAALAGAADLDRDGYITGSELAIFIRSGVANASKGRQTPLFVKIEEGGFHKGEFVMISPLQGGAAKQMAPEDSTALLQTRRGGAPQHKTGELFRDCRHGFCPQMMALPGGEFMFGSPDTEVGRSSQEQKPERKQVANFAISQHEITFDQWDACFKDGGCNRWPDDMGWGRGNRPVVNVSWCDAIEFTTWLSMKTGQKYRLASEIEWEYAARAGMPTARPWGDEIGLNMANCGDCGTSWANKSTAPVGSFPQNNFRLHDMLGNVWEWTEDCAALPICGGKQKKNAQCGIRGGSFSTTAKGVRSAARSLYPADRFVKNIGFRVVRESK